MLNEKKGENAVAVYDSKVKRGVSINGILVIKPHRRALQQERRNQRRLFTNSKEKQWEHLLDFFKIDRAVVKDGSFSNHLVKINNVIFMKCQKETLVVWTFMESCPNA